MTWHVHLLTKQITSPYYSRSRNSRAVLVRCAAGIKSYKRHQTYQEEYSLFADYGLAAVLRDCFMVNSGFSEGCPINARSLSRIGKSYNLHGIAIVPAQWHNQAFCVYRLQNFFPYRKTLSSPDYFSSFAI